MVYYDMKPSKKYKGAYTNIRQKKGLYPDDYAANITILSFNTLVSSTTYNLEVGKIQMCIYPKYTISTTTILVPQITTI